MVFSRFKNGGIACYRHRAAATHAIRHTIGAYHLAKGDHDLGSVDLYPPRKAVQAYIPPDVSIPYSFYCRGSIAAPEQSKENDEMGFINPNLIVNPFSELHAGTWQTTAGSVLMNPYKPILALKAGNDFQVYNLDTRQMIFRTRVSVRVVFWCWVNSNTIAMVTDAAVYHWDLSKEKSQPQLVFTRHARLAKADIVNYVADSNMNWYALVGLTIKEDRICGITQIHSVEHELSQPIEAHAVTFCSYTLPGNQHPSTLLVAVARENGNSGKIFVIELGPHNPGNQAPTRHIGDLSFEDDWEKYDFPVSIQISIGLGLVFIITKYGQLHLCDLESGQLLSTSRVCADILFVATLSNNGLGVLTISRNGQVLSISVKPTHIARYVRHSLQRPLIAERLEKVMLDVNCQMTLLST